jgi:uroporphyrinogen decarboxylase
MLSNSLNFMRVIDGQKPDWIPVECPINPKYGDGAYQFVTYQGALPPNEGGFDLWGTHWTQTTREEVPYIDSVPLHSLNDIFDLPLPDIDGESSWEQAKDQIAAAKGAKLSVARQVSCLWERLYFLYGFEKALIALVDQPDLVKRALDLIVDWQIRAADHFISLGVDVARISDDYGSQQNLLMAPRSWREIIYPRLSKLVQHYQKSGIPVALHSCGNLELIMDDLVGLDIVAYNIQTNANPILKYKQRYGRKFCLWGGLSTQDVLSTGSKEDIENAVQAAVEQFGADGGLILEPDQIVNVPDEKLAFFWESAQEAR